jgi:hypothetical protein
MAWPGKKRLGKRHIELGPGSFSRAYFEFGRLFTIQIPLQIIHKMSRLRLISQSLLLQQQQNVKMSGWTKHLGQSSDCPPITNNKVTLFNMRYCPYAQRAVLVLDAKKIP